MLKRSFFSLSQPVLTYDLVDPDLKEPESVPVSGSLTLLLPEAIDSTKIALIKKGDAVKKGERLKLYDKSTAYAICPVAGTIKLFDAYSDDFGNKATFILIKPDLAKTAGEDPVKLDLKEDISFADDWLRKLPGAPPFSILANGTEDIHTIIITCSDMDILSTNSQFVGLKYAEEVRQGASILKKMTNGQKLCITLPENLETKEDFGSIKVLKTDNSYPSALPAMVMKNHLNIIPAPGKQPHDEGVCFISAEALVSLSRVWATREAVFEKIITLVDKTGKQSRVKAVIGTPLSKIFARLNIHVKEQDRVIIGGPMRGFTTFTQHHPVVPDMDTVIIQDKDIIPELSDNPCVNCGKCIRICPANIPVNLLVRYLEADQYEEAADKFDLESCIECGLCAYVCTARIPLYQYIRLGKHELQTLRLEEV